MCKIYQYKKYNLWCDKMFKEKTKNKNIIYDVTIITKLNKWICTYQKVKVSSIKYNQYLVLSKNFNFLIDFWKTIWLYFLWCH